MNKLEKNSVWYKPWTWLDKEDHIKIRQLGKTLHALNFIEIAVVLFFCLISYDLMSFIMDQITLGNDHMVLGALATGVFIPLVGGIWSMLKNINLTYDKED